MYICLEVTWLSNLIVCRVSESYLLVECDSPAKQSDPICCSLSVLV